MNRKEIAEGLRSLGLKEGSIVLLHSSFLSLGKVKNGPGEVIKAFLDVIGKEGTILVPAFGQLGVLVEEVKHLPGAIISSCPVGTVAAYGPAAKALCLDHWKAETAHGKNTPYTRLADRGGFICLLGVDQDRNTSLHSIEALLQLPYLSTVSRTFKNPSGKEVTREYKFYPGPHRDFIGIDRLLLDSGAMKVQRIGNAQVRLIDSAQMFEVLLAAGADCPDLVLCDNPECADCVTQRAAIYAAEMARESFKLTVSSRLAGRYVPEMIENLQREGISRIELDYLQGKICAQLPTEKLVAAVRELKADGIEVTGIRLPAVPDEPAKLAEKLRQAEISRVILPLAGAADAVTVLKKAGLDVSLTNTSQTAKAVAHEFPTLVGKNPSMLFTFSAVNFARAGEHPFLYSYRVGRFIKTIGQLDIADCTWDGTETELAGGNAEIKELISILRCGNFSGWFCLGGGAAYPGDLTEAADNFRLLLKNM
ncbi:MAG: AAC(3) family N-acetyltransferase [Lentisphaeria bacterium]|nr:AAC(3) family N-acetyltransferase [Lentisphaeria bacterium]